MTLQEMIQGLDELSQEEQVSLFSVLQKRLEGRELTQAGDTFWNGVFRFRRAIEEEELVFTDEDFADLRDRTPGQEVEL
ncbi:hypothetical protein [Roseofilum capinflatum]|uniref:Uncharacterized protein n=1 Tax=Roseofilum capinflatum BLCC-M114 TaxID=3022440 RepID=A0ABT7BC03_9CYAN|nr:hypothetical protein [Roseofilum capinflatum]MDJ1175823.1 hypothetical protein [Roseofilum capinflatum BLCC-M114]